MIFFQSLKESKAKMCAKPFSLSVTILAQRDKSYAKVVSVERGKKRRMSLFFPSRPMLSVRFEN